MELSSNSFYELELDYADHEASGDEGLENSARMEMKKVQREKKSTIEVQ